MREELDELEPPPPRPPPELELEDDPPPLPPPPDDELDDDPPPLEDELDDDDELDEAALELDEAALELDEVVLELEPWPAVEDEVPLPEEDSLDVGSVTPVPHAVASIPTPASAAPPDSTRRNCRRSSRRASASAANLLDSLILPSLPVTRDQEKSKRRARYNGGSAPPS